MSTRPAWTTLSQKNKMGVGVGVGKNFSLVLVVFSQLFVSNQLGLSFLVFG
jgi:hypothetical protein